MTNPNRAAYAAAAVAEQLQADENAAAVAVDQLAAQVWLVEAGTSDYEPPVLLAICTNPERAAELQRSAYGGRAPDITVRPVGVDRFLSDDE